MDKYEVATLKEIQSIPMVNDHKIAVSAPQLDNIVEQSTPDLSARHISATDTTTTAV